MLGFRQSRVWKVAVNSEVVRSLETGPPKTADRRKNQDEVAPIH